VALGSRIASSALGVNRAVLGISMRVRHEHKRELVVLY
jgi:hypothetical protein